jgi:hypothetical protein
MGKLREAAANGLGDDGRPRTMVTEATIPYSDRPGFQVARWLPPLLRPGIGVPPGSSGWTTSRTPNGAMSCGAVASFLADFPRNCRLNAAAR